MYFKVTCEDEIYDGYQLQTGLNILTNEPNTYWKPEKTPKTLISVMTLEHIHRIYNHGVWLRAIIVPDDAITQGYKYRTYF